MRTKKIKNSTESVSESEISHVLKPDDTTIATSVEPEVVVPAEPQVQLNITENLEMNENMENTIINSNPVIVEKKKEAEKNLLDPTPQFL